MHYINHPIYHNSNTYDLSSLRKKNKGPQVVPTPYIMLFEATGLIV